MRRALSAAAAAGPRAVVLGAHADAIAPQIEADVVRLENEAWTEGIASSIRTAVRWAERCDASALVVLLVDQPLVEAGHVARLVAASRARSVVAVGSSYAGIVGAPALFGRALFPSLLALSGDAGAANVLRAHPGVTAIPCPAAAIDIDTPDDVTNAR